MSPSKAFARGYLAKITENRRLLGRTATAVAIVSRDYTAASRAGAGERPDRTARPGQPQPQRRKAQPTIGYFSKGWPNASGLSAE